MNKTLLRNAPFFIGFMINVMLSLYVYFDVEGGPASIKQGDWVAMLNEIPQTLVTIIVAIVLPYLMLWAKHKDDTGKVSSAGKVMLVTTLISAAIILLSHNPLAKELSMDIGRVILWFTAFYFMMVQNSSRRR